MTVLAKRFTTMQPLQAAIILNMLEVDIILNADQAHKALLKAKGFKFSGIRDTNEWNRRKNKANNVLGVLRKHYLSDFVEFCKGGKVGAEVSHRIATDYGVAALAETDQLLCAVQDSQRY